MRGGAAETCPRCGSPFRCGIDDAAPCPCSFIRLDAELQQRLRGRYTGCLCLRCLAALAKGEGIEPPATA